MIVPLNREALRVPAPEPEDTTDLDNALTEVISTLSPLEQKIIHARFWERKTLRDVGIGLGQSGGRIWQKQARALRKLRHPTRIRELLKHLKRLSP